MGKGNGLTKVLPVLFGFFIMGFVDVVGISVNYVQADFQLTDTVANLLPMMVFLWFAVFSVPTGLLMNRIGRKNTVLLSIVITMLAMLVPLMAYRYAVVLLAFALLGIGNTLLQVSLNPLVANVVRADQLTSRLTLGQFIKAVASFLGPIAAGFAAVSLGNWKLMFPVFALISLISGLWLWLTPLPFEERTEGVASFKSAFGLLKDRVILLLFFGIFFVVGADVGMNAWTPKFLMQIGDLSLEKAGLGTSTYFAARTLGALTGAFLLSRFSSVSFFKWSMVVAIGALLMLLIVGSVPMIFGLVAVIGFALANVFSIIFSLALQRCGDRGNEVSGLMIMGVAGGAVLPLLMGLVSDAVGISGAMLVLLMVMIYLLVLAFWAKFNLVIEKEL